MNNDDIGMVIIATPTIPWWKYRRSQILVGAVFLLLAALSIALGIVITSKNKPSTTKQDASSLPTSETPPSSPSLLLQTPSSCNESHTNNSMVNFGYYQEWAQYRPLDCNPVSPQKIDVKTFGYTHLSYAYGGISSDGFIEPHDGAIEQYDLTNWGLDTGIIHRYCSVRTLLLSSTYVKHRTSEPIFTKMI